MTMTSVETRLASALTTLADTIEVAAPDWDHTSLVPVAPNGASTERGWSGWLWAAAALVVVVAVGAGIQWRRVDDDATLAPVEPAAITVELAGGSIVWPSDNATFDRATPEAVARQFAVDVLGYGSATTQLGQADGSAAVVEITDVGRAGNAVTLQLQHFPIGWAIASAGNGRFTLANDTQSSILSFGLPPETARAVLAWRTLDRDHIKELTIAERVQGSVAIGDILTAALLISYDQNGAVLDALGATFNNTPPTTPSTTVPGR